MIKEHMKENIYQLKTNEVHIWSIPLKDKSNKIHIAVRHILQNYLPETAISEDLRKTKLGKPYLKKNPIFFNLSHTKNMALLAVSLKEVGVDIEKVKSETEVLKLAKRFFSSLESQLLEKLPPRKQRDIFFTYWTRKESIMKGTGLGFKLPLGKIDVSSIRSGPKSTFKINGRTSKVWQIHDIQTPLKYKAALSFKGHLRKISYWVYH